jgi:hypothetical protein
MSSDQTFNAKAFDYYPRLNKVRKYFETDYSRPFSLEDATKRGVRCRAPRRLESFPPKLVHADRLSVR